MGVSGRDGSPAIEELVGKGNTHTPMMKPLFVTSFNASIYGTSGMHLLMSYTQHAADIPLLACTEGVEPEEIQRHPGVAEYDLDGSILLREWLAANEDVIPEELGGRAAPCKCPGQELFGVHKAGCHWAWFNRNASRWFRKIAALEFAANWSLDCDALVWIDSDCCFVQQVSPESVEEWFDGASMFYLKGPDREVIESGVIGFRLNREGRSLLDDVVDRYRSGAFRADERWDDGYQFTVAVSGRSGGTVDVAGRAVGSGHVVELSRVGPYIRHMKGLHKYTRVMS